MNNNVFFAFLIVMFACETTHAADSLNFRLLPYPQEISADGKWNDVSFDYPITASSWVALRVFPSSHTNPVFVIVDGKPIHERKSAEWCRQAVDQCWKMKQPKIRTEEQSAAEAAYNNARKIYDEIIRNATENNQK